MVVLHGDVVHKRSVQSYSIHSPCLNISYDMIYNYVHSFENHSTKSRHALSFHAVDTENCKWSSDNWWAFIVSQTNILAILVL